MACKYSNNIWKKEDIEFLSNNKDVYTVKEFSKILNRSYPSLKAKLHVLGISVKRPPIANWYTEHDILFLKENYNKLTCVELSKILDKTLASIRIKLKELNLEGLYTNIITTEEQVNFIKENYLTLTNKQLAEKLGFKVDKVVSICCRNKLKRNINYNLREQSEIICSVCKNVYPNDEKYFYKGKNIYGVCKNCCKEKTNLSASASPRNYLRYLLGSITSTKNRKYKCNDECSIDLNYLLKIYNDQDGRCNITNIKMTYLRGVNRNLTNISIDRIDSARGYIKGNIQLVCHWANLAKTDLTSEDFKEFIRLSYNNLFL